MTLRQSVQKFGRTLSAMVMPNIGAFITWGLLTALFIPTGWCPDETLAKIGGPMMTYLLPLMIAFTAGYNVYGHRGGLIGAIATAGVVAGSDIPMFIGAMMLGPFSAWCIKSFDKKLGEKTSAGFEMLVNNFSIGIIGMILAVIGYLVVGDVIEWVTGWLKDGVSVLISHRLLPLVSVIVEPAKVLFLNNAVNHGICTPIGVQEVNEFGRSVVFMIESNPGAGLGILMAVWLFGQGAAKQSAPGAAIIHFFGGIHEIFFPYVLAQPLLLIATICGSASALLFYSLTGAGLVAPASPGSFIVFITMAPKGYTLVTIAGVLISFIVSFAIASFVVRFAKLTTKTDLTEQEIVGGKIQKIVFACDAGMGSSALGATRFKSRLIKESLDKIICTNSAIDRVPHDASVAVCQKVLAERAASLMPDKELIVIDNFLSDPALDNLLKRIREQEKELVGEADEIVAETIPMLTKDNILLGLAPENKETAIRRAGDMLERAGYVSAGYGESMAERENLTTTYMGMGIAIPHGTAEAKSKVLHSGIVVLQYPEGVSFGEERAHLVIGIAGVGDAHLDILAKLGASLEDEELLRKLFVTTNTDDIYNALK